MSAVKSEAKSEVKDVAVKSPEPAALAVVDPGLGAGLMVAGDERGAADLLARAAVYQGTAQEQEKYGEGKFKRGSIINTVEKRELASNVFVPIAGAISYVKWPKGARVPEYVYHDARRVPKGDLEWVNNQPPAATKCVTMVVIFDGEAMPYSLVFKRTGLKAYDQLRQFEGMRQMQGKAVGCYRLDSIDDKDEGGNPFKRLAVVPNGEIPDKLKDMVKAYRSQASIALLTKQAEAAVEDEVRGSGGGQASRVAVRPDAAGGEAQGDDIPF